MHSACDKLTECATFGQMRMHLVKCKNNGEMRYAIDQMYNIIGQFRAH